MSIQIRRPIAVVAFAMILLLSAGPAHAHEGRRLGDLEMEVGFGTEPALAGQPNSVALLLVHDGEPVVDLGDSLDVEVSFGDQLQSFPLEPFFEEGEFGTPGDYRAWFIPTRAGQYEFHFTGTIDGEEVDETFTSGPDTFSDVESPSDLQFPVQDPTTGELAELIDREVPRLTAMVEDATTKADAAVAAAATASDDASDARTLGVIGLVVGTLGLVAAIAAVALSRRKTA
jgi:hypothetical protein